MEVAPVLAVVDRVAALEGPESIRAKINSNFKIIIKFKP